VSEIKALFRSCPACGKRFHIKIVSKKLVSSDTITEALPVREGYTGGTGMGASVPLEVNEAEPVTVDVEEFQYAYRCAHCGHTWYEKREETHKES
jgi:DNA-directed RNA polymerase subunit RPC12/RpoP